jgi:hypothetical protein
MGTDPMVPNPPVYPATLTAPFAAKDGQCGFYVTGNTNLVYRVLVSQTLASGSWVEVTNYLQVTPTQLIMVPVDASKPSGFFRVVTP